MRGIYGIKVNKCLVYIGQAIDINDRIRQHLSQILGSPRENKYQLLKTTCGRTYKLTFWLLEHTEDPDLNSIEKKWITTVQPCLNSKYMNDCGMNLTSDEFYNIIENEEHYIEGATEWHYEKQNHEWRKNK